MTLTLYFRSLDAPHPSSAYYNNIDGNIDILSLSRILEAKHDIIKTFITLHRNEINAILAKNLIKAQFDLTRKDLYSKDIESKIKSMFREYLLREEHGYKSKRSLARGDTTFIDTGAYMETLRVEIEE